jgi:hypothetical protein
VHDLTDYEARGIPTVMAASAEFVDAAEHQAAALGIPDIARDAVYVPHPIQDATDDEMRQKARDAVDQILESLVRRP